MKVVILCGGLGSRLAEETRLIPKPMVKIGNLPILNHIIKIYNACGFPCCNILVKFFRHPEHLLHASYIRDVPIAYWLVKGLSIIEHTIHIGHLRDVPIAYRLVKCFSIPEHTLHIGHI